MYSAGWPERVGVSVFEEVWQLHPEDELYFPVLYPSTGAKTALVSKNTRRSANPCFRMVTNISCAYFTVRLLGLNLRRVFLFL